MRGAPRSGLRRPTRVVLREKRSLVLSLPGRPVAFYCCVSTDDQAKGDAIQTQLDFLRHYYCQLYGLTAAGEYL